MSPNDSGDTRVTGLIEAYQSGNVVAVQAGSVPTAGAVAKAYQVQAAVVQGLCVSGWQVAGYKLGLTDEAAQAAWGTCAPIVGRIMHGPSPIPESTPAVRMLEPELAFVIGQQVDASHGIDVAHDPYQTIASVHLAIEVVNNRYGTWDLGLTDLIADNAGSLSFALGPPFGLSELSVPRSATWRGTSDVGDPISETVALSVEHVIEGAKALYRWACEQGVDLNRGDVVLTGARAIPKALKAGEVWKLSHELLGEVTINGPNVGQPDENQRGAHGRP